MPNAKTRKTGRTTSAALEVHHQRNADGAPLVGEERQTTATEEDGDEFMQSSVTEDNGADEEDELDSCSSFSLQECINEFRSRRIRRLSTYSRDREPQVEECIAANVAADKQVKASAGVVHMDPEDVDLIKQNRSNKEQERKCKPCRNGFCYCFTSDSGDGAGCSAGAMATRGGHVRQSRRNRKSESGQGAQLMAQCQSLQLAEQSRRQSAPANLKTLQRLPVIEQPAGKKAQHAGKIERTASAEVDAGNRPLTAISRLETTGDDAPLIHIIQELHDNCVISEVRVNKQKMQSHQRSRSLSSRPVTATTTTSTATKSSPSKTHRPTAPPLEAYSPGKHSPTAPVLEKISEVDTVPGAFAYSSQLNGSVKCYNSRRRKHRAAGRLLQKRLSHSNLMPTTRRSTQPPPKPPRSFLSLEEKSTVSSLASTSPSVREAERVIDEFLQKRGVKVPTAAETREEGIEWADKWIQADGNELEKNAALAAVKREKRKSCPLPQTKTTPRKSLPTYPSLSDIERTVNNNNKKYSNYGKNIRQVAEKPVKELSFGWKQSKISEMLNYDRNANQRQFKSQAVQAEPQQAIGWQLPPKLELDTVDGDGVRHNLASNIETKNTPVKTSPISSAQKRSTQKFIWTEQLRNLSPWSHKNARNGNRGIKSNLKSSSRSLFHNSKKKILRLVTPKKENWQRQNAFAGRARSPLPSRTVAVQTSPEDLRSYELSMTPQSPPGSYHSAVQTSTQSTTPTCSQNTNNAEVGEFDFTRTVHSPPKKAPRAATQRKLNFPFNCGTDACLTGGDTGTLSTSMKTKTYRSYHADLDQDVTLSKLGYILGNIRAKLEASDDHAVRTFQEIGRREQQAAGIDCPDGPAGGKHTCVVVHQHRQPHAPPDPPHDPIYSEIEEDSIHISGTAQYDNNTATQRHNVAPHASVQHFTVARDPEVLYAKVNKPQRPKKSPAPPPPTALGKILHESLRNMSIAPAMPLPPLPEQSSSDVSYSSPPHNASFTSSLSHCQSLNNIRVMEQHLPPKRDRHLSKSELSLHRSEIFLDNLCRSEIIVEGGELERLEKVDNHQKQNRSSEASATFRHFSTSTPTPNDSISYDVPDEADLYSVSDAAADQMRLSVNEPPTYAHSQSTPTKSKPTFTTKSPSATSPQQQSNVRGRRTHISVPACFEQSSSCPATPQKASTTSNPAASQLPHAASLTEVSPYEAISAPHNSASALNNSRDSQPTAANTSLSFYLTHFNRLKNALRKSLRCSKKFVRNETKRLSSSFSFPTTSVRPARCVDDRNCLHNQSEVLYSSLSHFDLEVLFALDEEEPVTQQLAKTVSICRQLPNLEISREMVEAERLLLYSALRRDVKQYHSPLSTARDLEQQQQMRRFYVDAMRLPIRADPNQDIFFNYFYIVTFECGGVIKSTQSVECQNGEAIFRDCSIEFSCALGQEEVEMRCEVFVLRLRKLSTLALEPLRPIVKLSVPLTASTKSSSSSCDEIASRFRLHASFLLNARDFAPYEYVECETKNSDKVCLRAARSCRLPLTARTKSTNLAKEITLTGRAEVRFPKQAHSGFLNVQDPHTVHNWNRRWVVLDGLQVGVWPDANELTQGEQPWLSLDLRANVQMTPLTTAPRELCARQRSFCLQCGLCKAGEEVATAAVFFAADTQAELTAWLEHLNAALELVATWMG